MSEERSAIAIVDDDDLVRRALCRLVVSLSYRAIAFASGEAFLKALDSDTPFCALVDLHMPEMNGLEVLVELRARRAPLAAVIITGSQDESARERCLNAGAAAFLKKPLSRDALSAVIGGLP
ncbi:Response regulator protein TmoT [Ensifer adhaerens]|uniref:FixJ family two-component response regulator n=1 Tax=Ensifer adhaerens TaxID=106592 RepID=A0ACC5T179_ENSAD|nr:response regulator [Ensifer adhaerens]MBP1874872.1 FixJ family two-component response regulator [Ensifer adhaerens]NRP19415.1 Response regulator protein TmoT [Ensifer adhaerens]